ncbi:MAG: hypothetical protein KAT46_03150 [Deltaproteobacteria bacterium]|nr:hypothetical protein [Deltaproteobacteria bacterium]
MEDNQLEDNQNKVETKKEGEYRWGKPLAFLGFIGFLGLALSLYLLSDYFDVLLQIVQLGIEYFFGNSEK